MYINFVEFESLTLHAKFQDHRTFGSGEVFFFHIWSWRPSGSCDLDHLYKLSFPPSQGGSTLNLALAKKSFENGSHMHVYSPGAGADNPLG